MNENQEPKLSICTDEELEEYMDYLYSLRKSGVVNMFGATSWLADEFGLSKRDAKEVLFYWMQNFDDEKS